VAWGRFSRAAASWTVVFVAGLFGFAAYTPTGAAMRAVAATTVVWIIARFAF